MFYIHGKDTTSSAGGLPPYFQEGEGGSSYIVTGEQIKFWSGLWEDDQIQGIEAEAARGIHCNEIIVWLSGASGGVREEDGFHLFGGMPDVENAGFPNLYPWNIPDATGYVSLYTLSGDLINQISGTGYFGLDQLWTNEGRVPVMGEACIDQKHGMVAVGAPYDDTGQGAVYIYNTGGEFINKLTPPTPGVGGVAPGPFTGFGMALSIINSELIAIGAPFMAMVSGLFAEADCRFGEAYIYNTGNGMTAVITGNREGDGPGYIFGPKVPLFGSSVVANETTVAIGGLPADPYSSDMKQNLRLWNVNPDGTVDALDIHDTAGNSYTDTNFFNGRLASNTDSIWACWNWGQSDLRVMGFSKDGTIIHDKQNFPDPNPGSEDSYTHYGIGFSASDYNYAITAPYYALEYDQDQVIWNGAVFLFDLSGNLQTKLVNLETGAGNMDSIFAWSQQVNGSLVAAENYMESGFQIFELQSVPFANVQLFKP